MSLLMGTLYMIRLFSSIMTSDSLNSLERLFSEIILSARWLYFSSTMPSLSSSNSIAISFSNPSENYDKFSNLVDKYDVGFVLDYKGSKLYKFLTGEKGWKEIYSDEISAVLARDY